MRAANSASSASTPVAKSPYAANTEKPAGRSHASVNSFVGTPTPVEEEACRRMKCTAVRHLLHPFSDDRSIFSRS